MSISSPAGGDGRLFDRTVAGRRLRLQTIGADDAPRSVVMLHHGLGSLESWKALPRLLAASHAARVLVYERQRYGGSDYPGGFAPGFMEDEVAPLLEIIDRFAGGRADLVGHSDGGSIALLAAADAARVRSVVSVAAHVFVEPLTLASIEALLRQLDRDGPMPWLTRFHGARGERLLRDWAAVWLGREHARWDMRERLRRIAVPLLAIQGADDEFGTIAQLNAIVDGVAGARRWLIPDVGHTPFVDEAEFAGRIATFWRRDAASE